MVKANKGIIFVGYREKKKKKLKKLLYNLAYILSVWVKVAGVEGEWILKVLRETASNKCGCHHTCSLRNLVVTEHLVLGRNSDKPSDWLIQPHSLQKHL